MRHFRHWWLLAAILILACHPRQPSTVAGESRSSSSLPTLCLDYQPPHWLLIRGPHLPRGEIRVNYLEAYCRAGSTDADWVEHTVIPHRAEKLSSVGNGAALRLRDTLADGVIVDHQISVAGDTVEFRLTAFNPSSQPSQAHWAQPCVRLAEFCGFEAVGDNLEDYLPKCFVFAGGKLVRLSEIQPWVRQARYVPGQVWPAPGVPRADVNPRPLSPLTLDNGLIGAFSADDRLLFGVAWEPYQELFQGVARCLHADLRLGGLRAGETKHARGKIYLVANDVPALLARYAADFPEHVRPAPGRSASFDPVDDLISLHYDHAPDKDDAHSAAADRTLLESLYGSPWIALHAVAVSGAYGKNASTFNAASDAVMDAVWSECGGWLSAHDHWDRAVERLADRWRRTLQSGGDVWVKEGGQSDLTAAVLKRLTRDFSGAELRSRLHVVQHSDWNEEQSTDEALAYVKRRSDYVRIRDANAYLNAAGGSAEFVQAATAHPAFGSGWQAAFRYYDPRERLDFSDTGELLNILGLPEWGIDEFCNRFLSK